MARPSSALQPVAAEDWCGGVRGVATGGRLTARAGWSDGAPSWCVRLAGGRRERGRRPEVCRPQRAGRPPGAPEGRALDPSESQHRQCSGNSLGVRDRDSADGLIGEPITYRLAFGRFTLSSLVCTALSVICFANRSSPICFELGMLPARRPDRFSGGVIGDRPWLASPAARGRPSSVSRLASGEAACC